MADVKDEEIAATAAITTYVDSHMAEISAPGKHAELQNRLDLTDNPKLESVVVLPEKEDTQEKLKTARARMRCLMAGSWSQVTDKICSKS